MMKKRSLLYGVIGLMVALVLGYLAYDYFLSPTKVALVHFPSYQVSNFVRANEDWQIDVKSVEPEEATLLTQSDVILIFGAGYRPSPEEEVALAKAREKGIPIYSYVMSGRVQCQNISDEQRENLHLYYKHRSQHNYRNLLRYLREQFEPHKFFSLKAEDPQILPEDLFYYLEPERIFLTADELTAYLKSAGKYMEGAKRIALLTGTLAPLEGNRAHVDTLISKLMQRGYNVYPFITNRKAIPMLEQIRPDAVINIPMGRLAGNAGDGWLQAHNIPIYCPVPVNQKEADWLQDPIGLSAGSLTARITLSELDGGILPMVISTEQEGADGLLTVEPQSEEMACFVETMERHLKLRELDNADKRLAIVYFRGAGNQSLVATGLEVIPSLYNFLRRLQVEGYDLTGLPDTLEAFERQVNEQGAIWGKHSEAEWRQFVQHQQPQLIPVGTYEEWASEMIQPEKYQEVVAHYGKAPGTYMTTEMADGTPAIAVARIQYGNVVLLPQQATAFVDDQFKMVHGVELPPPHSYLAPYLWIHKGFDADALLHFGTHGNLEFTPGKQVALSRYDWPKSLIGTLPHFYYYENVAHKTIQIICLYH